MEIRKGLRVSRLSFEDGFGPDCIEERPFSRPVLAVGQDERVVVDCPDQRSCHDLALAAPGEQQKTNDVCLLYAGLPFRGRGWSRTRCKTADLLARKEAREASGRRFRSDAPGRGSFPTMAASNRAVHAFAEEGSAHGWRRRERCGCTASNQRVTDLSVGDPVEPLRSETRKQDCATPKEIECGTAFSVEGL